VQFEITAPAREAVQAWIRQGAPIGRFLEMAEQTESDEARRNVTAGALAKSGDGR